MSKNDPRKALGKGIHSLLPPRSAAAAAPASAPAATAPPAEGSVNLVPIDKVRPNPNQPRREFEPGPMLELSQSILREGIIQPIIVRRTESGDYEIIAGERRWRAAGMAGLKQVPVITRAANDQKVLELAIIENVQREDLNPIELAQAFYRMGDELGLSHDQIGEKTGKDRATVTNTIRLLQLPDDIQALVSAKKLSPGHARALLKLSEPDAQREVAERSVQEGWSVRQIEEYTRPEKAGGTAPAKKKKEEPHIDPNVKAAIGELERTLGTRVRIVEKGKNKGTIEIEYYSQDDLDRVYNAIVGEA
jgi:ParB family chromosome partitioning protein